MSNNDNEEINPRDKHGPPYDASYYNRKFTAVKRKFLDDFPDWTVFESAWVCSEADFSKKTINLRKYHNAEKRLYVFLHEIGHVLVCEGEDYSVRFRLVENKSYSSDGYKINRVEEEIEAWAKGWGYAQNCKVYIDMKKFDRLKTKLIKSYFNWALGRTENIKGNDDDDVKAVVVKA